MGFMDALKKSLDPVYMAEQNEKVAGAWDNAKWYGRIDNLERVHIEWYANEKDFSVESNRAVKNGWEIITVQTVGKTFSVGKALTGAVLLGGIGAIAGIGGKKGKITVTYSR